MFSNIETVLLSLIHTLPLEIFVFVASFIEEVIAPVPSSTVLLLTGSFAAIQERPLLALIPLVFIAALGKTIGAIFVYYFSERVGGAVLTKFGGFFGVSHAAVTEFGQKITGTTKDYFLLTLFRTIPIVPSAVISIGCGLLKIPLRLFIITTMIGTIIRDAVFIYIGYEGTQFLSTITTHPISIELLLRTLLLACVIAAVVYFYYKRKKITF